MNLLRGVEAEAGLERGALRAQGEHALGELDRQMITNAVGEQRQLAVLKQKHLLARRGWRRGRRGGRRAELENDPCSRVARTETATIALSVGGAVLAAGVGLGLAVLGARLDRARARSCSTPVPFGTDLLVAAQLTGADGRAIGVDMTRAMFDRAASSAWRMGLRTSSCTRD